MSSIPSCTLPLTPSFPPGAVPAETPSTQAVIRELQMLPHPEGGYFVEIDRDARLVPNPFRDSDAEASGTTEDKTRNASTSILYLLTPHRPQGVFHRNKARTVHSLIEGRGRYVLVHDDEDEDEDEDEVSGQGEAGKRVESFVVGHNVAAGEKVVWVVEGGKYKASFLLSGSDSHQDGDESRLLISETVVPGFEFKDHDFLTRDRFEEILSREQREELGWLVKNE